MQAHEQETMSETDSADFGVETIGGPGPAVTIAVHGQADLHTAPQLREAMTAAIDGGATSLIVDLSDATFVDSMTLGVLLGAVKRLRPHGGKVAVVCVSPHIRRIFEITLLDRVFEIHETLDDAQQSARARG
jgi:anti-sigma B factor antagonist